MSIVRVFSDLHAEFGREVIKKCTKITNANKVKYTILAGDITNFEKKESVLTELVSKIKDSTDKIIYVLGNHEYYEPGNKNSKEIKSEYKDLCDKIGIHLLENSYLETDDFVFYGATMWSNTNEIAYSRMMDRYSFESRQEVIDMHEESAYLLNKFIGEYHSTKPLIVITHHLPSFSLIDQKYRQYGSLNTGFASELDYMIKSPVSYWIYGHTHTSNNTVLNNVKLICNPHGYPGIESRYFKDCTF
jgi:predicted MPP superfamily phosphohydrolase